MKKLIFFLLFVFAFAFPLAAAQEPQRVIDNAGLLSSSEEKALVEKILVLEEKYNLNLVILTENKIRGTVVSYSDDYYDNNGYSEDGVLLLINMQGRDWYISTAGKCIGWLTDYGIERIGDGFTYYLSDGEYYDGFDEYLNLLDDFFRQAEKGKPYDVDHQYRQLGDYLLIFCGASVLGLIIAFIVLSVLKRRMKTAVLQPAAGQYVKDGQFQISSQEDRFLYSNVSRTAISSNSGGSSGGSSSHTSSGGSSHGGGGGKF